MKTLTRNQLEKLGSELEDFVLINVLGPTNFREKHIPHSINIPHEAGDFIETVKGVVGDLDRKIVLYCASFECNASTKAAERLEAAGLPL